MNVLTIVLVLLLVLGFALLFIPKIQTGVVFQIAVFLILLLLLLGKLGG